MAGHAHGKSDLKIGLAGLAIGLVWVAIVATIAHLMAAGG